MRCHMFDTKRFVCCLVVKATLAEQHTGKAS